MNNKRDIAVDIVKFLAVFLIINSHADVCYPRFSALATGGAIGDSLFLFVSGFTLFLGKQVRFDNYYKRRINRIYPSAIASSLAILLFGGGSLLDALRLGCARPFLNAIMIYYVLLYFVRKYAVYRIKWVLMFVGIVTLMVYIYWFPYKYETGSKGIYGITTTFRWIPYFAMMLLGSWVGLHRKSLNYQAKKDFMLFSLCLVVFYAIQFAAKKWAFIAPYQIITIPFLAGVVFYFYKVCNAPIFHKIYSCRIGNWVVLAVSGLCLESYLTQNLLFTDKLNGIFPLNLFFIYLAVLVLAYFVRCVARIISQTFKTEDYDWKKVFAIV